MAMHEFSLESLIELDGGRVPVAFNQAVQRLIKDCEDRPNDKAARKALVELSLSPVCDDHGNLDEVKGSFKVKDTVPSRETKEYSFGVRKSSKGPMLVFNDLSDDNVNQKTIDD